LIRDPRLAGVINDVVIEFGTTRYQDVIDQFISGEDVPSSSLRRVWQDTTQIEFDWDLPIYEEFLRAIRSVNATRLQRSDCVSSWAIRRWTGRTSTPRPSTWRACRR
jgi:hypothetical protein